MKPEATRHVDKAATFLRQAEFFLAQAQTVTDMSLSDAAGRAAYLAGFHVAQALLFEKTGKVFKSHNGVNAEFARLVRDESRVSQEARGFLGRTYSLKAIADYEGGPGAEVTLEQAARAVREGRSFVACVTGLLGKDRDLSADEFIAMRIAAAREPEAETTPDRGRGPDRPRGGGRGR